jgi:hypothetical protein
MNKTFLAVQFFFYVLFFSCTKRSDALPYSTGKLNTISVLIDDQLWNGEIGDSIRNKFASPIIGFPEEEPLFSINQYPLKLLEGFATNSRAILIIKKESKNKFEIKKNQYAIPQNVFHISGKTVTEIVQKLENYSPKIIQLIEQGEIAESQRINRKKLLNTKYIEKRFHVRIQVPSDFEYVLLKPNFVWLKKKINSGSSSLLVYQVPLSRIKKSNIAVSILAMRDSIGKYIKGTEPRTYMINESGYTPYFFKSKIDDKLAYETRGTWQLQNDYMSGPFVNYVILDSIHNRLLVLEGFCYSPSKGKRDVIHELEAIIHSVYIHKSNTFTFQKNK